jgi:hypothetical protein
MSGLISAFYLVSVLLALLLAGIRLSSRQPLSGQGLGTSCALVLLILPMMLGSYCLVVGYAALDPSAFQGQDADELSSYTALVVAPVLLLAAAVVLLLDPGPPDPTADPEDNEDELEGFRRPRAENDKAGRPAGEASAAHRRADRSLPQ